jgi:branched-chain amino acid transport system substrate-binding protein
VAAFTIGGDQETIMIGYGVMKPVVYHGRVTFNLLQKGGIMRGKRKSCMMVMLVVLLSGAFVFGYHGAAQSATKTLKVGVVMPISGPISTVGMAWVRGYELYFNKVNEGGGVKIGNDTYRFDVIPIDSKVNPEAAGTATKKLVFQNKATFVFGAILEQNTQAIYDVTLPNKVLHLISWVNVPRHPADVSGNKPLCTRPMISPQDAHRPLLEYLLKAYPNTNTVALVLPDIAVGSLDKDFKSVAAELGIKVVGTEIWNFGTTDFVPVYTKVLSYKADAICTLSSAQAHYQLMSARQLGFTGPFVSTSPLGPDVFLAVAGPEACTNLICAGWDPAKPTGALKEVVKSWQAKYGAEPFISDATFAWDGGWILVQALEKAQTVDPEKVLAVLDSMTAPGSLKTSFGPGRMGGLKTYGGNRVLVRPIPVSYLMDGQAVETVFMPIEVE